MKQTTFNLGDKTDQEIEDDYKKSLFLSAICNGKLPQRRNLFKNIIYLSGLSEYYRTSESKMSTRENYDKCQVIYLARQAPAKHIINSPEFITRVKRYLDNHFKILTSFSSSDSRFELHYSREKVKWALIDHDLLKEHPENTEKRNNNFVYVLNYHHGKVNRYNYNRY